MIFDKRTGKTKDGREIVFRSPEEEDAEEYLLHYKSVSGESEFLLAEPQDIQMSVEDEKGYIRSLKASPNRLAILAIVDGKIVGNSCVAIFDNSNKTKHRANLGIAIRKEFWDLGIGTQLLSFDKEVAKTMGARQLELDCFAMNERAIGLYKKCGFEEWGRVKDAFRMQDGSFCDELKMGMIFPKEDGNV